MPVEDDIADTHVQTLTGESRALVEVLELRLSSAVLTQFQSLAELPTAQTKHRVNTVKITLSVLSAKARIHIHTQQFRSYCTGRTVVVSVRPFLQGLRHDQQIDRHTHMDKQTMLHAKPVAIAHIYALCM